MFRQMMVLLMVSVLGLGSAMAMDHSHKEKDHSSHGHDHKGRTHVGKKALSEIHNVLAANEQLHSSFFKYDSKEIEKKAKLLSAAIEKLTHAEFRKLLKYSGEKVLEIKAKNDKKENNKVYALVSMALIHIVNKYDVGADYNEYSCPMVKKKWLQHSKTKSGIQNPYAKSMPDCGMKNTNF